MNIYGVLLSLFFISGIQLLGAQSLVGCWQLMDDETGQPRTTIEMVEQSGCYKGHIEIVHIGDPDALCKDCPGKLNGQRIEGLPIISGLRSSNKPDHWKHGTIINPLTGKQYRLSAWFKGKQYDKLYLRGKHWTGLYVTQVWYRLPE